MKEDRTDWQSYSLSDFSRLVDRDFLNVDSESVVTISLGSLFQTFIALYEKKYFAASVLGLIWGRNFREWPRVDTL